MRQPLLILLAGTLCALPLAGCATAPQPVKIQVADSLRQPCTRAAVGALETEGDVDALIVRQEEALGVCDKARGALVDLIDGQTQIVTPDPPFWKFWK